jgi:hypothetical protein
MKAEDGTWRGISIDLWRRVADQTHLRYRFQETTLKGLTDGVAEGSLELPSSISIWFVPTTNSRASSGGPGVRARAASAWASTVAKDTATIMAQIPATLPLPKVLGRQVPLRYLQADHRPWRARSICTRATA